MNSYTEGLHITDNPACNEFMRGEWGDFPRVQFDRKLGAELAPGETIDVAEKSLEEYLKYAGIPRDRWGDLSIVVTGAESSSYLRSRELGHAAINKTDSQGLDVVVKTGYCIDPDATLRHELCHVKDAIDGKIDLQRADLLYRLGASIHRKDLRIQAAALNTLGALAYVCGMYFNSEELKEVAISVLASNNVSAAALLGIHLKGYYHNPCEERAREAEKKGEYRFRQGETTIRCGRCRKPPDDLTYRVIRQQIRRKLKCLLKKKLKELAADTQNQPEAQRL